MLLTKKIQPPSPTLNTAAKKNYAKLRELLLEISPHPRVLNIGSGTKRGVALQALGEEILSSMMAVDIRPFPNLKVVGDGQRLPFKNSSFDGAILQAFLEHVLEPKDAIQEALRVLKSGGLIYVECPFLQGIHGSTDYSRFTLSGLRNLCAGLKEIRAGICAGPASSLTWVLQVFLALLFSFSNERVLKALLVFFGWVLSPLKYLDFIVARMSRAHLISSAFYYLGKKRAE